jgi:hypothetical protein
VRGVVSVAAASIAAALTVAGVNCAFAEPEANGVRVDHYLLFSGFDVWRNGGFIHGGLLWSPNGLANEGFTLKALIAGGSYQYQSGTTDITGRQALAAVMPGWRFKGDRFEFVVFAGPDLQSHHLTPDDPGNRLRGTSIGLRVGGDIWYQPTDMMMATASVSASTIGPNIWARAAFGWRLFNWAWVGPEASAFGDHSYSELRIGIHATAFKTGLFEWSAGVGHVHDSDHRSGIYGHIGVLTRR